MSDTRDNLKLNTKSKLILIACLKGLGMFIVSMCFIITTIVAIFPRTAAKINNYLGLTSAEEECFERSYKKSGSLTDLYNLILFEIRAGNTQKSLYYLNIMMSDSKYAEFIKDMDSAAIQPTTNARLLPYTANTNGYFVSEKVKCMYKLNLTCETYVYSSLFNGHLKENAFSQLVELILSDTTLTSDKKFEKIETMLSTFSVNGSDEKVTLEDLLTARISNIETSLESSELNVVNKVILRFELNRICKSAYNVYDVLGDEETRDAYKIKYQNSIDIYNNYFV